MLGVTLSPFISHSVFCFPFSLLLNATSFQLSEHFSLLPPPPPSPPSLFIVSLSFGPAVGHFTLGGIAAQWTGYKWADSKELNLMKKKKKTRYIRLALHLFHSVCMYITIIEERSTFQVKEILWPKNEKFQTCMTFFLLLDLLFHVITMNRDWSKSTVKVIHMTLLLYFLAS